VLEKDRPHPNGSLKEILDVANPEPFFHENLVPFLMWMADYYVHPVGQVIQTALPSGVTANPCKTGSLTEKGRKALALLPSSDEHKKILAWIDDHPGKKLPWPTRTCQFLQRSGWIVTEERMPRSQVGPLKRKFVRICGGVNEESLLARLSTSSKARNETDFLKTIARSGFMLSSDLNRKFPNGSYLQRKWVQKGVLERYEESVYRNPAGEILFPSAVPAHLSGQQQRAVSEIRGSLNRENFCVYLLYGVTGSGKTEVYYQAVEHVLGMGRQAIVLVPEISLAAYMESVFRSRLGDRVGIYHSGLSRGERYDQWLRMARGEVQVVIGARSALFSPLPRPGLIIVDEEHDAAYKQEEGMRYQARDAAVVRAKMEKAVVILGSGTPSVQSFHNGFSGRYRMIVMPERIEKRPLPAASLVDMKEVVDGKEGDSLLSPKLRDAIQGNLQKGNQAILFLNRRGFHRLYLCRFCGQTMRCPNCDVALTYHLEEDNLACHYCGFRCEIQLRCSSCGKEGLKAYGFGTERLEQELCTLFPNARVARMDTDSTRKKGRALRILRGFGERDIDILVGTQMITKGYDFPGVTLVGVIAADLSLAFPDFRGGERTFQLLSQAAGRSGRGEQGGEVIIQTFNPDHYAIRASMQHNFELFFHMESRLRRELGYPPFCHLACVRLSGNSRDRTAQAAEQMVNRLQGILGGWPKRGQEIQILGPAEAPIAKLKGKNRWQILVKAQRAGLIQHLLANADKLWRKELQAKGVHLVLDVDPYQML